jgi:CHAT domain-containing protein
MVHARFVTLVLAAAMMLAPASYGQPAQQAQGTGAALPPDAQAQLARLQTALQSAMAARDARAAGRLLNQLGDLWLRANNPQAALDAYTRAVSAARLAQDVEQGVAALNGLGNVARAMGKPQEAQQAYQRAQEVATAQNFPAGKADALNNQAQLYASQRQPQKALELATQALAIRRALGDRAGEGAVLAEIAAGYSAAGERQQALDYAQQALAAYQAAGASQGIASTLLGIGDLYASIRDGKAVDYYAKALALARQSNFVRIEASALYKLGLAENALGKNDEALEDDTEALGLFRRLNMPDATGQTLTNLGLVRSQLGENEKALDSYKEALAILHTTGDRDSEALALNDMGMVYQQLGDRTKALDLYRQALAMLTALGDRANAALTLDNIGAAYLESGQSQAAIDPLNQAIALQAGLSNPRREAIARVSLGMAYHKLGDNPHALESLQRGLELVRQANDRENEARAETALAKVYWDMGDTAKATAHLLQALPLAKSGNDPLVEAPIFYGLMLVYRAQPALAIYWGKQSVNLLQQVRGNMQGVDRALQSSFVTSKEAFYRDLADLLIVRGRLAEAQQVLGLLKQQEYADYVRGGDTGPLSPLTLTPAEQKAEQDYTKSTGQLVAMGVQWAELKAMASRTPQQEKQFKDLAAQLDAASKALNDCYARLYVLLGKDSAANKQVADVKGDVAALEEQLADSPRTVALYTMLTSDHYRVIVVTASATVEREVAIPAEELNRKVAAFGQSLRTPSRDPKPLAQELYSILLGPVKEDLDQAKAETLVWSLDGVLRYVPMAALYDGKQYVVEKYNTVTITPASIVHLEDKPDVANLSVAAMGIARKYEDGLPALPAVTGELDDVVKDAQTKGANGALPGTILLDGQFTEKAMEEQLSGRHGVVHIASHFVFKPGDDSLSYLLLAGKDEAGAGYHLTVADFRDNRNLTLRRTDLLTLSACETGMSGSASNGREVDGLGTTAQLKGAKAVLSSLWPVNDASTGQLMGDFYGRWAAGAGKVAKVEALRQAQLDLLLGRTKPAAAPTLKPSGARGVALEGTGADEAASYAHPFYWAPFVLMGNWR